MVQGHLERTRSGLDDVLFASPAEVHASVCARFEEFLANLKRCRRMPSPCSPSTPHRYTDAVPVLKPAPSRPQSLLTADPCAILTGLIC